MLRVTGFPRGFPLSTAGQITHVFYRNMIMTYRNIPPSGSRSLRFIVMNWAKHGHAGELISDQLRLMEAGGKGAWSRAAWNGRRWCEQAEGAGGDCSTESIGDCDSARLIDA